MKIFRWQWWRGVFSAFWFPVLLGFVGAMLIVGGAGFVLQQKEADASARVGYLKQEVAKLDKEIDEVRNLKDVTAALLARKQVIEVLRKDRTVHVRLLDLLVRERPEGLYLNSITQQGGRINITGHAASYAGVSRFLGKLDQSPLLGRTFLAEVKAPRAGSGGPPDGLDFNLFVYLRGSASAAMTDNPLVVVGDAHPGDPK